MRETAPGDPYPVEALGPLQAVAEAVHDKVQAPVAIGAQSALAVASLAVQGLANVETLAGSAPCSIFALTIAVSGERKSSCDRLLMAPVHAFQRELVEEHRSEAQAYKDAHALWDVQHKEILRTAKKDAVGAEADLRNLGPEPEEPLSPVILASEPTLEGLVKLLANGRPSIGLFTDEGGGFIGGYSMNRDNRLKTISGASKLWDGDGFTRVRAGDGAAALYGRRLACHIMAQPIAAAELLADPVTNGQGFLARFLIAAPTSTIGARLRVGHKPESDAAIQAFGLRIEALLRRPLPLCEGARNELEPPLLRLSGEARALLQAFALEIERLQAPGEA
ncbi:MAG: YfjI family protein, partial [Alphaproteobacteria bacterium]